MHQNICSLLFIGVGFMPRMKHLSVSWAARHVLFSVL